MLYSPPNHLCRRKSNQKWTCTKRGEVLLFVLNSASKTIIKIKGLKLGKTKMQTTIQMNKTKCTTVNKTITMGKINSRRITKTWCMTTPLLKNKTRQHQIRLSRPEFCRLGKVALASSLLARKTNTRSELEVLSQDQSSKGRRSSIMVKAL